MGTIEQYGCQMTNLNFDQDYTGSRCYMSITHLCGVREGDDLADKCSMPTLAKTSEIYVTPVTDQKLFV